MNDQHLQPARHMQKVAMPRFRRSTTESNRLSEIVNRALTRAFGPGGPFGIFILKGKPLFVGTHTCTFASMLKRQESVFIGTYDKSVKATDLIEDLSEFFSDEAA